MAAEVLLLQLADFCHGLCLKQQKYPTAMHDHVSTVLHSGPTETIVHPGARETSRPVRESLKPAVELHLLPACDFEFPDHKAEERHLGLGFRI